MLLNNRYHKVLGRIPIIGMIHLAGEYPVKRALEEIAIFEEEGVDGAIIENYHNYIEYVESTLRETAWKKTGLVIGVNILPNEFKRSFALAKKYKADFIQLDHVSGTYQAGTLNLEEYLKFKERYPRIFVLGGVWPKYYRPVKGSDLEKDIREGMQRAEAIVVTGEGTGRETPLDKIKQFREVLGEQPLVIGAGLNHDNAYEQLRLADGAIVGTSFKYEDDTKNKVDRIRVRDFMAIVKELRERENPRH